MALIWNETFNIGIKSIDQQHKEINEYFSKLNEAISNKKSKEQIDPIITRLIECMITHFHIEETYFDLVKYKDANEHIKEHGDLRIKVASFYDSYTKGKAVVSYSTLKYYSTLLLNHFKYHDLKYVPYLLQNGIK